MSQFFDELMRRKVVRVGIAYLVAAWVLLQVTDVVSPILDLPGWTSKIVLLLLAIGFVICVILAWAYEITPEGVKPDSETRPTEEQPRVEARKLDYVVIGILAFALIGVGVVWLAGRDFRWARDFAYPAIEQYAAEGNWEEAYALAKRVEALLPDDSALNSLWEMFASITSIPSNPSGATVYRRPYTQPDAEWEPMGTTPIYDIHIPLGLSVLRIELDGYSPLLRVIGGEKTSDQVLPIREQPMTFSLQINPGAFDFDTPQSLPDGMVRVPGETIVMDGKQTELRAFYIDRYEVTNRDFKAFVNAGGYERRDLWEHEFVLDGERLSWDQAMARFTDTTGRPGASTWKAGNYPDGADDHPVAGVSWYEAAAYARFVRRELPSVHHWRRAFGGGMLSWLLPASNLESDGTAPVGQFHGVGWSGTFDMAGNVREWCFNSSGDQRVILGGGWNDVPYIVPQTVFDPGSLPAFDRSSTNGFRLAITHNDQVVANRLREPVSDTEDVIVTDPDTDDVFAAYLRNYEYDPGPLNSIIEESQSGRHWTRERISITSNADKRMALYLYLPKTLSSRYQTIVYWPSIAALFLDSVDQIRMHLDFALQNGRAVAVPVLDGTFERRLPGFPDWGTIAGRDLVIQQVKDMRRTIDYLETRADIDSDSLAFYGLSWGGRLGAIALVVEPRLKIGILNQAGLQHLDMPETSVLNFLPRVDVPVLQFNGRYDTDFRFETSAKPFFDLLGTSAADKKHVVEPTGHFVSQATVIGETLDWLDKYLGPVSP